MTTPSKYRILLAGPTLLYAPVYLAWLCAGRSIQERVKLWTPRKQLNGDDQLMDEYHQSVTKDRGQSDVLFCVGDILRYHAYRPKNGKRRTWTKNKYLSSLITSAPVTAYKINQNQASAHDQEILLCHRNSMTTYEIAEVIKKNPSRTKITKSVIFDKISLGYEEEYINHIIKYVNSGIKKDRIVKRIYLIVPDTHAGSSIAGPIEVDRARTKLIRQMHGTGEKLLFTGILDGKSDSISLRDDFLDLMSRSVENIQNRTDWAADIISNNVAALGKFGNFNRNEIFFILERIKKRYEISNAIDDNLISGITAAAKMRYNWTRCHQYIDQGVFLGCNDCRKISDVQKPFRRL